jgi:hypothetical protein
MANATDFKDVLDNPKSFTWGHVTNTYQLDYIGIVESRQESGGVPNFVSTMNTFHVYVDGKDTSRSSKTLEGAILIAIGHKHLEQNHADQMARAAVKLFGL